MAEKSHGSEKWLEFDFPIGCVLKDWSKDFSRKSAADSGLGGCCPYSFCVLRQNGCPCDPDTAKKCAERCEEFYEKYVKEEEK